MNDLEKLSRAIERFLAWGVVVLAVSIPMLGVLG